MLTITNRNPASVKAGLMKASRTVSITIFKQRLITYRVDIGIDYACRSVKILKFYKAW